MQFHQTHGMFATILMVVFSLMVTAILGLIIPVVFRYFIFKEPIHKGKLEAIVLLNIVFYLTIGALFFNSADVKSRLGVPDVTVLLFIAPWVLKKENKKMSTPPTPAQTMTTPQVTTISPVQPFNKMTTLEPAINETMQEEDFWAQALEEFESINRKAGLWAKFYAESEGNESQAKAKYLKLRAEQLADEYQKRNLEGHQEKSFEKQRLELDAPFSEHAQKRAELVSPKLSPSQWSDKLVIGVCVVALIICIIWVANFISNQGQQQSSVNTPATAPASVSESTPTTVPVSASTSIPAVKSEPAPEYIEWKKINPWYENDREKTAIADEIAVKNKGLPLAKILELVDKRIAELYGNKVVDPGLANADNRFKQVSNGILQDTKTELMWEQSGSEQETNWESANAYAQSLTLGGYDDWRLPTKAEWEELVTYVKNKGITRHMEIFFSGQGFKNRGFTYWSSTVDSNDSKRAWNIDFYSGQVDGFIKSYSHGYYARAVRGGVFKKTTTSIHKVVSVVIEAQRESTTTIAANSTIQKTLQSTSKGRFREQKNGIVIDTKTGLMWQQSGSEQKMYWEDTNAYVKSLYLGGYSGWRLPTKKELLELVAYAEKQTVRKNIASFFDGQGFKNTVSPYWSSERDEFTSNAWCVYFNGDGASFGQKAYVRAVRSGQ